MIRNPWRAMYETEDKKAEAMLRFNTESKGLDLVVFRKEILDSLERAVGKGGVGDIMKRATVKPKKAPDGRVKARRKRI
jgi:hypothetical protein